MVEQKQININEMETEKLEAICFRIGEQIKEMQRQYNQVYQVLINRAQEESKKPVSEQSIKTEVKDNGINTK